MASVQTNEGQCLSLRGEGQLLQTMVTQHFHEDNLYWAQIRYLVTLQLAFFAAWYAVGPSWLGPVLMVASALISWQLWSLAEVIRRNRDVNLPAVKVLSSYMLTVDSKQKIEQACGKQILEQYGALQFATHALGSAGDVGRRFQRRVFALCIVLNVVLGTLGLHDQLYADAWLSELHPRFQRVEARVRVTQPNPTPHPDAREAAHPGQSSQPRAGGRER